MFSVEIEVTGDRDLLIADLYELGACGIAEPDGNAVRAFFEDSADRAALLEKYAGASSRVEEDRDWVQHARDLLQPAAVGRRFFLSARVARRSGAGRAFPHRSEPGYGVRDRGP